MKKIFILNLLFIAVAISSFAQEDVKVKLVRLQKSGKLTMINRNVATVKENNRKFLHISTKDTVEGVIWLPVKNFKNGKLEMVARGRDILQGSFVGIAFHGMNDSTYDNVYCRPFNFRTPDSIRKIHAIQYVYLPDYNWPRLRKEQNGIFEKNISDAPPADDWFTLTLIVDETKVNAYINHEQTPSLTVNKLNTNASGKVGITGINCDILSFKIDYTDD